MKFVCFLFADQSQYINITQTDGISSQLIISIVINTALNANQTTFKCTYDGDDGYKSQFQVVDILPNPVQCPSQTLNGYHWPATRVGHTAYLLCEEESLGKKCFFYSVITI